MIATLKFSPRATEWLPAAPAQVRTEAIEIDRRVCNALRCGHCRRRGLAFVPQHTKGGAYRVLARCPACNRVEHV